MNRRSSERNRTSRTTGNTSPAFGRSGRSGGETDRASVPSRRARVSRPQATRRRSGPPLLFRLIAYALLLLLTARLAAMVWEEVSARRADTLREGQGAEMPFQPLPLLKGGLDDWTDASLASALERAIPPTGATTAIYVKSLNTGAATAIEGDRVYPTASLFKVPLLVEVLRQQSLGLFHMDTPVRLEQRHWADGAGVLQAEIGNQIPVQRLLELMIGVSDNVAALALLELVGTDNVNITLQSNDLQLTRLRIGEASRDWGGKPGENTTTAREMGLLLEKLATGKILNESDSREAVRLLGLEQQAAWLPGMLPAAARVAHKSGELPGVRHDAGLVYTPRNQFVVVVLNEDLVDYEEVAQTIARVARAAYDYFETGKRT